MIASTVSLIAKFTRILDDDSSQVLDCVFPRRAAVGGQTGRPDTLHCEGCLLEDVEFLPNKEGRSDTRSAFE